MNPTYDFDDQVALVTGASSGMGLAIAEALSDSGAAVVSDGKSAVAVVQHANADRTMTPIGAAGTPSSH